MIATIGVAWQWQLLSWWQRFARAVTIRWVIRKGSRDKIGPCLAATVHVDAEALIAAPIVDTRVAWLAWGTLWTRTPLVVSPFPWRRLRNFRGALIIARDVFRSSAVIARVHAQWERADPCRGKTCPRNTLTDRTFLAIGKTTGNLSIRITR